MTYILSGSRSPMYHAKVWAISLYFSMFGLMVVDYYPVKFWNLASVKGRKFEVLLLSSVVTPAPRNCPKFSFCPPSAVLFRGWAHTLSPSCIGNWQQTSRGSLKASAHICKFHAFLELYSLWSLLFGWSLMTYIPVYYFCNRSSFSNCS